MNRADIKELALFQNSPCITIILDGRTDERLPQARIECEKAIKHALIQKLSPEDIHKLSTHITHALKILETYPKTPGIVLFCNTHIGRWYALPVVPQSHTIVDLYFATRNVEHLINRGLRYWILSIIDDTPSLYDGYEDIVTLVSHIHRASDGTHDIAIDLSDHRGAICNHTNATSCRYLSEKEFVTVIDQYMEHLYPKDPLPIVFIGSKDTLNTLLTHSSYATHIIFDGGNAPSVTHDLVSHTIWPAVQQWYAHRLKTGFDELARATEAHLVLTDPVHVWKSLKIERCAALFVEQDHEVTGCEHTTKALVNATRVCTNRPCVPQSCPLKSSPINIIDDTISNALDRHIPLYMCHRGLLKEKGLSQHGVALIVHPVV